LKIGFLICNSREETVQRFAAAACYLSEKLGRKIIMIPMHTYQVLDDVQEKNIDFFKTNSIVYIQLKEALDINILAGEKRGPLGRFTTGKIISKKGSGIKTIADLKGKKYAFGPMFAPFGYLVQYDLMLRNGINPEEDLEYYAIPWGAYKHDKAIFGVQMGAYDAGSGPDLDLIKMTAEDKIRMGEKYTEEEQDFNIVAESEPAPYCTFSATKEADPALAQQIKKALLELTPNDLVYMTPERLEVEGVAWDTGGYLRTGEVLNVCKEGLIDGYEEAKDSDYDVLREMMKRVNMAPYATFDDVGDV
jgi:phosphonate transport system substrate-binding protein